MKSKTEVGLKPTEQQLEVLKWLCEGKTMTEIAQIMNLNYRTVSFHKYQLQERLQLFSDALLIRWAIKNKIVVD